MIQRRAALTGAAATAAAALAIGAPGRVRAATPGPYVLPPLPYAASANEAAVDAETMQLHHDRHHAAYVKNLNAALRDYPQAAALTLPVLLGKVGELPDSIRTAVRNNGGGHANHSMFWTLMGGRGGEPSGQLGDAITRDFGSFDQLRAAFVKAGTGVFGSGWVFVTCDRTGRLALVTRPNQDTPLMEGMPVLFGNDCWEHAYYLRYQNRRADYLAAWWNIVNWDAIAARYREVRSGTLVI